MEKKLLIFYPKPPYDFYLSAKIFYLDYPLLLYKENDKYAFTIKINNSSLFINLYSTGDIENPKLYAEIYSSITLEKKLIEKIEKLIKFKFNLDYDLLPFYKTANNDKILADIIKKLFGLKNVNFTSVYEALIIAIIEQQISLSLAHKIEKRLIKKLGDFIKINNKKYYEFPNAKKISSAKGEDLRKCGLSSNKIKYILDISRAISINKLDLEILKEENDIPTIRKRLCELKGVGIWTADLTMISGMNKVEVMPENDIGLKKCISLFYGNNKTNKPIDIKKIAEKWGNFKGIASYYIYSAALLHI